MASLKRKLLAERSVLPGVDCFGQRTRSLPAERCGFDLPVALCAVLNAGRGKIAISKKTMVQSNREGGSSNTGSSGGKLEKSTAIIAPSKSIGSRP
jgi:hypothetical protein